MLQNWKLTNQLNSWCKIMSKRMGLRISNFLWCSWNRSKILKKYVLDAVYHERVMRNLETRLQMMENIETEITLMLTKSFKTEWNALNSWNIQLSTNYQKKYLTLWNWTDKTFFNLNWMKSNTITKKRGSLINLIHILFVLAEVNPWAHRYPW